MAFKLERDQRLLEKNTTRRDLLDAQLSCRRIRGQPDGFMRRSAPPATRGKTLPNELQSRLQKIASFGSNLPCSPRAEAENRGGGRTFRRRMQKSIGHRAHFSARVPAGRIERFPRGSSRSAARFSAARSSLVCGRLLIFFGARRPVSGRWSLWRRIRRVVVAVALAASPSPSFAASAFSKAAEFVAVVRSIRLSVACSPISVHKPVAFSIAAVRLRFCGGGPRARMPGPRAADAWTSAFR
jgi:hypothetical protein